MSVLPKPKPSNTQATPAPRHSSGVARLVVTQGPSAGNKLLLTQARATAGRHATNDLVLADPRVSAAHLELERGEGGRLLVRDLGTTNGTWIGAHRIISAELAPGALLRLGDSAIRVEVDDRAAPAQGSEAPRFGELVGASPEMRELFATLERVASTQLNLLVQGEAGTGKDVLARAVHACSPRRDGPFVVLAADGIPPALADSILFGHEPGAFPGADTRHVGVLERAQGGTLFLDEIGALPIDLQAKLLRVLETRSFSRLGGDDVIAADLRVIAATRRDLRGDLEKGPFREDLFVHLAAARVVLPPLRARAADIPLLARHFLDLLGTPESPLAILPEAEQSLCGRGWPGNVRELRTVVARAAAVCQGGIITVADLAGEGFGFRGTAAEREPLDLSLTFADAKARAIERFEIAYLAAVVRRCRGNVSRMAREANLGRNHLRVLLKRYGLYDPGDS